MLFWDFMENIVHVPKSTIKKQKPTYLYEPREFLKQVYRLCLIVIKYFYFDYRINKPFAYSRSVICVSCSVCSLDLDVLCVQRIMGFSILITHKSTRSEITWVLLFTSCWFSELSHWELDNILQVISTLPLLINMWSHTTVVQNKKRK